MKVQQRNREIAKQIWTWRDRERRINVKIKKDEEIKNFQREKPT